MTKAHVNHDGRIEDEVRKLGANYIQAGAFKSFAIRDGNLVTGGSILVRQRGRKYQPGLNVGLGKDDTLFAKVTGKVKFEDHGSRGRFISIHPVE